MISSAHETTGGREEAAGLPNSFRLSSPAAHFNDFSQQPDDETRVFHPSICDVAFLQRPLGSAGKNDFAPSSGSSH